MLFSNEVVSDYIHNSFEPVWVSVRPVPLVTINFGNGNVVKRTLHGNVATYVCSAEGHVIDVLPGIYEPKTYVARLRQLERLHEDVVGNKSQSAGIDLLTDYHVRQHDALNIKNESVGLNEKEACDFSPETGANVRLLTEKVQADKLGSVDDLGNWKMIAQDTDQNEMSRRLKIHGYLKDKPFVKPDEVAKWIYREVLNADLDDP